MIGEKKQQRLKSCRNKIKEKLKCRLNVPVPLRNTLQYMEEEVNG
jgi:hypothetical protein